MTRALLTLAFLGLCACGVKRVPDSIIEKLPYESRIDLLEAENDLAIAVDKLDETRAEVGRTKEQIRRAKDRLSAANGEVGAASDQTSRDVAVLAVSEADARLEWLKARQGVNLEEEKLADIGPVDIACVPIGGSLSATKAAELVAQLDPRIVVAMPLDDEAPDTREAIAKFFHEMGGDATPQPKLSVTISVLPAETTAVLLESRGKA